MVTRRWWLVGASAALAGPYMALDGNLPGFVQQGRDQLLGRPTANADPWQSGNAIADWSGSNASEGPTTPAVPLQEALRADVTPDWVVSRWPRVATVVGELDWGGMRVPLISGLGESDFVGSLTYYFDQQQRLRRISLEGYTGDERPIVTIATQNFGLQAEPSVAAGLYTYRWNREPLSVLAVQYAPVVRAEAPHLRRRVLLEFNRPEAGWRLSPAMKALVSPTGW